MKIVVLGGTGFLGSHIANRLAREPENEIIVVGRQRRSPPGCREISLDVYSDAPLAWVLEGADACIHLVSDAVPATAEHAGVDGLARNLALAERVARACVENGVGRLLFSSSGGTVYGRDVMLASESSPCRPIGLYGVQKAAVEALLRAKLQQSPCRLMILRISNPYGTGQESQKAHGVIGRILHCLSTGESFTVWGDGSQVRDYIFVSDVAEAVVSALAYQGSDDVFNIGSGVGVSMSQLIALCEHVAGTSLRRSYGPHPRYDVDRISLDVRSAAKELGWRPTTELINGLHTYFSQILETT